MGAWERAGVGDGEDKNDGVKDVKASTGQSRERYTSTASDISEQVRSVSEADPTRSNVRIESSTMLHWRVSAPAWGGNVKHRCWLISEKE